MYSSVKFNDLAQWTQGVLSCPKDPNFTVTALCTDTRSLKPGDVFLALKGENFDGNLFLDEAIARGASGIICENSKPISIPKIAVKDGLVALISIGQQLRESFQGNVFAITGSAGKSSTKDMLSTLLGDYTVSSPASFNNLMGVSRTLCLVKDDTKNLVLEMGMNNLGEIAELCSRFKPHFGLITNIGDAHIGKLGGQEGVFRAKKEMFDFVSSYSESRGVAVNADDPWVMEAFKQSFPQFKGSKLSVITYSTQEKTADVFLQSHTMDPENGSLNLNIKVGEEVLSVALPIFGEHHAQNIIAAIAMAKLADTPMSTLRKNIHKIKPAKHRGEIISISEDRLIIDESYNSNPKALLSSLASLKKMSHQRRKILVLGEMRELGAFSNERHDQIGDYVADWSKNEAEKIVVITVQGNAKRISDRVKELSPKTATHHFESVTEAMQFLPQLLAAKDTIFIKGSRGVKLDLLIEPLQDGPA